MIARLSFKTTRAIIHVLGIVTTLLLAITAPAYAKKRIALTCDDLPSAQGSLTEAMAWQKGLPAPRWYERNMIPIANALFASQVLKEKKIPQ
jgi:hypothetical protein